MGDLWGISGVIEKKPLSQTLYQVGERNGASPDDLIKETTVHIIS